MARVMHETDRALRGLTGYAYEIKCVFCGVFFRSSRIDASFCSSTCRSRFSRQPAKRQARLDRARVAVLELLDHDETEALQEIAQLIADRLRTL
jgi:predicted  nucleic acid-binding Zn-ribbon protein